MLIKRTVDAEVEAVIKNKRSIFSLRGMILLFITSMLTVGCGGKENFTQQATTQFFNQDNNPPYLDILWMIDNRSPMNKIESHLVSEAQSFFTRLDGLTDNYQMGLVSADMQFADGQLQPTSNPVLLTKNVGSIDDRVALFGSMISQVINLQTGAVDEGFASVLTSMNQSYFTPRSGVPLVLVFISDSDDHSPLPTGQTDAVAAYTAQLQAIKGSDPTMLHVYSINYLPLASGATVNTTNRCATEYNADIDQSGFQNRYFNLATALNGSTADLCGSFSSQIDLTGLKLKTDQTTFVLSGPADPNSITVQLMEGGDPITTPTWTYDAATTSIVFDTAPVAGSTVEVTFNPGT